MSVRAVSQRLSDLGEGPHWDVNTQKLYYVDAFVGDVCRLDPATGLTESVHFDGITTFVIPYHSDPSKMVITITKEVRKLDFSTGETELLTVVEPDVEGLRFNDGKCDARGRLFAGTLIAGQPAKGSLYRFDTNNTLTAVVDKIDLSNGLAWSLGNDTLYFIDSEGKKIYSFSYDIETGAVSNQSVLFDYNDKEFENSGVPDGMTIDIEGKLWVACYGGACVLRLDPVTKKILRRLPIPAQRVTSCCFGGPHFDILYVTTASGGVSDEDKVKYPKSGAVFEVTGLETRGQPPNHFIP